MSSVSSLSSAAVATSLTGTSAAHRRQRPDPAKMAEQLFSKLDTSGKGYIEQSDLESALSGLTSASSAQGTGGTASAKEIFTQLDGNGDGKITQDEMSSSISKLAESLDNQFNQSRMQGGMPPPPPPSGSDTGFTKDELTSQLAETGSSDTERSSLLTKIVQNFDKADSNQDGKVSFQEAMTYDQTNPSATSNDKSDAQIFRQIMELMRSYGSEGQSSQSALSSLLSTVA